MTGLGPEKTGVIRKKGEKIDHCVISDTQKKIIDTMFSETNSVNSMKTAVAKLLEKLRDRIEAGEYGIILGIDGSGRLPALLVSETIKKIYEMRHIKTHIKTYFIAGNREPNRKYIKDFEEGIEKVRSKIQKNYTPNNYTGLKRLLVIDDIYYFGNTLKSINEILQDKRIFFDIATLCLRVDGSEDFDATTMKNKLNGTHTFYGYHGNLPNYYGKNDLTGLQKNKGDVFGNNKNEHLFSKALTPRDGKVIKYVRQKIKETAIDIAKQFIHEV